jgi:arylsulfatase A-like enzyme
MTGRYNYRTGVVDTFLGRALMHPDEVTLAEMLAAAGYRTGIFGKWHLGDNYPMRPMDQGFQECLVLKGGGIGQPSDPPGGNSYFDPTLEHNGQSIKTKGYCSDVFTDAALKFVEDNRAKPFFVYLAFNCPHTPLQVPEKYEAIYKKMNLAHSEFPAVGHPLPGKAQTDVTAKVYGMVTNIDDNLGRLFAKLDALKLTDDTIVVFLTDNGPQQVRYNSGMLERKGSVHDGGIRVPCFIRWPGKLEAGRKVDRIAAHIDLAPTLLDACGVARPKEVAFDGVSLLPLLKGEKVDWPDRTLYVQWHRGDEPELYRACAVRSQKYKLVQPLGRDGNAKLPEKLAFKLYDMVKDPLEQHDIADKHPDIAEKMRKGYETWFKDVSSTRGYAPPRIHLGTAQENPVLLTRQDWRGPRAGWGPDGLGHWEVQVARAGNYNVTLRFAALRAPSTVQFSLGEATAKRELETGADQCTFESVRLTAGAGRLETWVVREKEKTGVLYVEVKRRDEK